MSSSVFLAQCDPESFERTVRSEVDLREHPDHPEALDGLQEIRFWGAPEGSRNENTFEKMNPDDLVLFYQDGTYVGSGWIGRTFEDAEHWASTTFWDDAPSTLIYTIEDFTPVSVPKPAVNRIFGYDGDYTPQALMRVAAGRVDATPAAIERALERYSEKHG